MLEITRDLKDILICALRYALGRKTYITGLVADYIMEHREFIDERVKNVMLNDLNNYFRCRKGTITRFGKPNDDECDYNKWLELKNWLEENR